MQLLRSAGALLVLLAAQPPAAGLERIAWLGGCLEMRKGDLVVEEHRMHARGASMLGMSRPRKGSWNTS